MKMTQQVLRIMAGVLLALPVGIRAIENLQISVPCPDVVLAWPSVEGETYIVQHRATLDTNSAWETLTNALPAEVGTNWTWFVHSNQMIRATNGGSGGGGGSAPPSPMSAKLQMEAELAGTAFPIGEAARQFLAKRRVYPPYTWDLQKRPPYPWELENRPPLPWEPGAMKPATKTAGIASGAGAEIESDGPLDSGGETNVVSGFYRVVREGVHLWGVTNDMVLSGVLEIPIELGTTNELRPGIQLFADGIALPVCQVAIPEAGFPVARWNTAFLRNGTCSLHAECSFLGTEDLMVGVTNSVTVDNGVSFTDFQALFGDQMWVYAELAVNDADVEIDMFADGEFIGTFYDSTSDGVISFVWDLTDGNNYVFTNETFRGEFYAAATGGNPRTNRPAIYDWYKEYGLPGDTFSVAWAITKVLPLASRVENLMLTGVINILASPAANDPYQLSPGNTYDGAAFRMTSGTKTNLLSYLADPSSRNFYFFGHGNARSFGDYSRALGGWLSQITAEEISDTLTNRFPSGRNYHPYRFVFLDSCQSANGPLSDGFGIARHQMPRAFYKDLLKVGARAFVGYMNPSIPLPTSPNDHTFNADMLGQFFFKWREGQNLQQIVNEAKQHPYWPLDPSATIWGATNLFRYHQ
jgi:hypothetical protein